MKRFFLFFLLALLAIILSTSLVTAAPVWGLDATDTLNGSTELVGFGAWEDNGPIVSWDVVQVEAGWVYSYSFGQDLQPDISHILLEVTNDYPAPIVGHNGQLLEPQWWTHGGNIELPAPLYGVKADHGAQFYSFFSDRSPVWGNLFVKSGHGTYAYTAGLDEQYRPDYIVRPDGDIIPTPEPATMAMLGIGLGACAWRRRRRQ